MRTTPRSLRLHRSRSTRHRPSHRPLLPRSPRPLPHRLRSFLQPCRQPSSFRRRRRRLRSRRRQRQPHRCSHQRGRQPRHHRHRRSQRRLHRMMTCPHHQPPHRTWRACLRMSTRWRRDRRERWVSWWLPGEAPRLPQLGALLRLPGPEQLSGGQVLSCQRALGSDESVGPGFESVGSGKAQLHSERRAWRARPGGGGSTSVESARPVPCQNSSRGVTGEGFRSVSARWATQGLAGQLGGCSVEAAASTSTTMSRRPASSAFSNSSTAAPDD